MWVRWVEDYSYSLPSSTTDYKAGTVENVTRECADLAISKGKAVRMKTPRKGEVPTEEDVGEVAMPWGLLAEDAPGAVDGGEDA